MEAKYKPNHGVCNLFVDVLIDGLVHLLQYPDFCEICCFFGWVFFLNTFPNNVYEQCLFINLSYAQSFLRMKWSRWEMSGDDVLFSTRCHNYLAEKICYQIKKQKKNYFFYTNLWKLLPVCFISYVYTQAN